MLPDLSQGHERSFLQTDTDEDATDTLRRSPRAASWMFWALEASNKLSNKTRGDGFTLENFSEDWNESATTVNTEISWRLSSEINL